MIFFQKNFLKIQKNVTLRISVQVGAELLHADDRQTDRQT